MQKFASVEKIKLASQEETEDCVGKAATKKLREHFKLPYVIQDKKTAVKKTAKKKTDKKASGKKSNKKSAVKPVGKSAKNKSKKDKKKK